MNGFVVVGTDTDAGKTAFSLLFLAANADRFDYWKPVETGDPDSLRVRRLVPTATVHEPLARFTDPVAPALAAKREGRAMPGVAEILAAVPRTDRPLLIETFGGPLSPLTDDVLQIDLIRAFGLPVVLVSSSAVGAVGRTLSAWRALAGVDVACVVLLGDRDEYAEAQIAKHTGVRVESLALPSGEWTPEALHASEPSACPPPWWGRVARLGEPGGGERSSRVEAFPPTRHSKTRGDLPHQGGGQERGADGPAERVARQARLVERDRAAIWHPYTSLADPADPLPVVSAQREFLHLADGRTVIDAVSSWWTILHGHRHPPLVDALTHAAHTLDHVIFAGVTHPPAVELAELMLASMPWSGGRAFYSDNGSTAVEVALKLAYQFWCHRGEPHRTLFVGFENGYHGDTFGAMAVGRDPLFFGTFEPLLFGALQVPVSADTLDDALKANAGKVAAVILEPLVQGAGGMRTHTPQELRDIFEVTKRHGVLFIADEVMTGCRTGRLWAHSHAGIAPDLICSAKTITGGMLPLSVTLASPEIVEAFQTPDRAKTFFHGHSFTANPLASAVGAANWKLLGQGEWQQNAARIEAFWHAHLEPLRGRPRVKDVRICGTIAAVELDAAGGYLAEVGPRIRQQSIARGVLLRPLGSVVYAMPPLGTSDESLARIAAAIAAATQTR
ncbi:adenosylmethionine-8-amino-7-oxononanoate aminotransferase : Adenosylmethionine-8-amino-7-oxononanoate aminotransferase OS=Parachlamydia acanthamoebae (strain UV7) GN=bioA PE=3 SV=1: AAA_26: Aminotran_3 [Gemmataceae bacterium]|nr:adenosylmethionine-8-amino-7-oxononanoate aminotransferase : Adenosylmethionine-8-amino-7-oxononanoate aminotransferase OS=Parachlamydia acanthamoebae (strain UV7) GN=bioA PE=3 SV=1: AAA_26: Aminotran_3 [Gemmataceae bacterium]VTU00343.1 adenosylmethionine-8-amino-7-oxononanoate aminotransferase : Adenosylmethionine-8-amino-7-oxononanoate aminotransferase OS=Parachlamydia acanthamoebae (strain UV7) GN=bioA PE=3 SV=1: AAA_26: Aminotran_3 [Gemmataceae bacterium]